MFKWSGGDLGKIQGMAVHSRLLNMFGGASEVWGLHSFEGAVFSQIATYGTVATNSTRDDLLNSRLIIMWGWNPTDTQMMTNTSWYLTQAKEKGIRIVSVDPKYTNTTAGIASEWIPIRPGTDAAMLIAMAYVLIQENLHDRKFIDTYTVGFDKFKDYVTGVEDGIPKTPQWAAAITGVPAQTISRLARDYAKLKPAALIAGVGPGRTACGEQYHRAASTLAAMTGNLGVHGGDPAASGYNGSLGLYPFMKLGPALPIPPNPVEAGFPRRKNAFSDWGGYTALRLGHVNQTKVADALLKGKSGGYPADYKLFYVVNNHFPNQYFNINRCIEALKHGSLEFYVLFEQFMTPGAKFADVILPVNTSVERNDITGSGTIGWYAFMGKTIDSVGESKSHLEICTLLAQRLGIKGFSDKTDDEWVKQSATASHEVTDYEAFKRAGGLKLKRAEPYAAFQKQIEDPQNNPFPTPSGKIEIYCQRIADMDIPDLPAIPKYIEMWEGIHDPLARKYPLQLVTTHFWRRAHSQYDNLPWLREIEAQRVMMNTSDATARGIKDGDTVRVFNDRGVTVLPAHVTERIMPGVVDIPQGAWFDIDKDGVERAGNCNVLMRDEHSPAGSYPTNTALVQIEKA